MLSYLKKRIEANQGISISKLPGHLSQLPPDVRAKYGSNEEAIRKFLEKHSGVFVIDKSDRVFLRPVPSLERVTALEVTTEEVTTLCNVPGKVLRIFPNFGFVTVEQPFKTTVYFDLKSFEEGRHTTLTSSGLSEGDCVTLDATRSVGHKASFKATRVERIENGTATSSSIPAEEPSADGDNGLRNQSGIIHTVKPGYGFITFGPKKKNCAFFHSSVVDKALTKGNKNLADILATKDRVHFDAKPDDSKGSKWVKWKATRVWRVPPELDSAANSDTDSGDEVFMSEDEADMESILKDDSDSELSDVNVEDYPVGYPDWEDNPEKPLPPGDQSSEKKSWTSRRMLSMIKGIFFKQSDKVGYVCSLDGNATACVVIPVVYHMGVQVNSFDELPWSSGIEPLVEVFFDAVEDDDMWVATLVWTGVRPPRLPVNCSEHIFNAVRTMAKDTAYTENKLRLPPRPELPSNSECEVEIFQKRQGVIISVAQHAAWCEVQEPSSSRRLKFTSLYRDGAAHTDCLDKILQVGDKVSVDYMAGMNHNKGVARCSLVWQGKRPSGADCFSPEEFIRLLNAGEAERGSSSSSPEEPCSTSDMRPGASPEPRNQLLSASSYAEQMLDLVVDKEGAAHKQPQRAAAPKQTGAHASVNAGTEALLAPAPTARSAEEFSISIYPSVRGRVVEVLECYARVMVQEAERTRNVEFFTGHFYKDGKIVLDNLCEVLCKGDEVFLNYMVAKKGRGDDVVHCDLVWQGQMPGDAASLGPDEFAKNLGIKAAPRAIRASEDDSCRSQERGNLSESTLRSCDGFPMPCHIGTPEPSHITMYSLPQKAFGTSVNQATAVPLLQKPVERLLDEPQVISTRPGLDNAVHHNPPVPSDETLLRLARMVVAEFRAVLQEDVRKCVEASMTRSRIVVRDAESQTCLDHPRLGSAGGSTPPFFSPCSTPTQEMDALDTSQPKADSCHLECSDTRPEGSIVVMLPEQQKAPSTDKVFTGTLSELDDNSESWRPAQFCSDSGPGMVETCDDTSIVKPSSTEPADAVGFVPLELSLGNNTSHEQDSSSTLQLSSQVLGGNIADVAMTSDDTGDVSNTISHNANYGEALAAHIVSKALEEANKSSTTGNVSDLSEPADEIALNYAESHGMLPQNDELGKLPTENEKLGLSGDPEVTVNNVSKLVHEDEAAASNMPNGAGDCIASHGLVENEALSQSCELDEAPADTIVSLTTKNDASGVVNMPGPLGSALPQRTAENGVQGLPTTPDEALVDPPVLQQTAKIEPLSANEAQNEVLMDVTGPQETAE